MPYIKSIDELNDLVRPVVDEAIARAALEGEIYMLEHLGQYLTRAGSLDDVRDWQQGHLAFLKAARDL